MSKQMSKLKQWSILVGVGLMVTISLANTSTVQWVLPQIIEHYKLGAEGLAGIPALFSTISLALSQIFLRLPFITPKRVVIGSFAITLTAWAGLVLLPPLGVVFALFALAGLMAMNIGSLQAAVPAKTGLPPALTGTVITATFTAVTVPLSYAMNSIAYHFGMQWSIVAMLAANSCAVIGAVLLFQGLDLPSPAPLNQQRMGWNMRAIVIAILAGFCNIPITAMFATNTEVLAHTTGFRDPVFFLIIQLTAVPAAVFMALMATRIRSFKDNGLLLSSGISVFGGAMLLFTLSTPNTLWWLLSLCIGLGLLNLGKLYEGASYGSAPADAASKTLINLGLALGATVGPFLGVLALQLHAMPVVVAMPATIILLLATIVAQPRLRRWVADARRSEE